MSKWLWVELATLEINATEICSLDRNEKTNKPSSDTREKKFVERMERVKQAVKFKREKKDTYRPPPARPVGANISDAYRRYVYYFLCLANFPSMRSPLFVFLEF